MAPATHQLAWLRKWAAETPDEIFVAERDAAPAHGWRTLIYEDALKSADNIAIKFVTRGL